MQFRYPAIIKIDGTTLTDESRGPLQEDRDERSVVVDLASGKKKKYIKSIKRKWTITWDNFPMNASQTVDGFAGRNEIRGIAQEGTTVQLTIQDGVNTSEIYTAYVDSYQETLTTRRVGRYSYTASLTLLERG